MRKAIRDALINQEVVAQEAVKRGLDKQPNVAARLELDYAGVVELTRNGAVHFHVVLRGAPYLPQSVWSRLALRSGFGYVVDVRRVKQSTGLSDYLGKTLGHYLTKQAASTSWPSHFRRIRFSQRWAPKWRPIGRRPSHEAPSWTLHRIDPPIPPGRLLEDRAP